MATPHISDSTATKVFEITGVYFVNCYFNQLYNHAYNEWKKKNFETLLEAYRAAITMYNDAFSKVLANRGSNHFMNIIKDLHQYYQHHMHNNNSLEKFVDVFASCLLPKEEYDHLATKFKAKEKIFQKALTQTMTKFTIYYIEEIMDKALKIRNDNDQVKQQLLYQIKEDFVELLKFERNKLHSMSIAARNGVSLNSGNVVPKELFTPFKQQIKKLIEEKHQLTQQLNKYADLIERLKNILEDKEKVIETLSQKPAVQVIQSAPARRQPAPRKLPEPEPSTLAPPPSPIYEDTLADTGIDVEDLPSVKNLPEYTGEEYTVNPDVDVMESHMIESDDELEADD